MGKKIDLVEEHYIGGTEHVRIFERLLLSFRDAQYRHLVVFPQIE